MAYPLLTCSETQEAVTLPSDGRPFLVGRRADADLYIPSRRCSREQVRICWRADGFELEPLSRNVPTQVDGTTIHHPVRLRHGATIAFGTITLSFLERPDSGSLTLPAPTELDLLDAETLAPAPVLAEGEFAVVGDGVLGRGSASTYLLDHPQVSRRHAALRVRGEEVLIEDLGSANGTFIDGRRIREPARLVPGDRVDIGPFSLEFRGDRFVRSSRQGNVLLVVRELTREVPGTRGCPALRILDRVSLVAEPGELLVILGPSGSGKSTLMNALSARRPADSGRVEINGVDLYAGFEALKQGIAFVPQREVLHEDLGLSEALEFTARLRLPGDTPAHEVAERVRAALARVDLAREAQVLVKDLSGGQRKRASLASETVCEPNLLFVDEVTSGLDEQADWEMMRLLRRSAERGETVVCITHNLANVEEFAHKVAVLARGGALAFYGKPDEARAWFEVARLSEIYGKLARHEGSKWSKSFQQSAPYRSHLAHHLQDEARPVPPASHAPGSRRRGGAREALRQLAILSERYLRLLARDRRVLALALGQSLLVAAVLVLAFSGAQGQPFLAEVELFLLGVSCLWFGCSNASKEIVKERAIYLQERDVNLSLSGYLGSKLLGLGALGSIQVLLLFAATAWRHDLDALAGILGAMAGALAAGTALGLAISSVAVTPDQATTLVPIVLIPQIVLAGAIVRDMNELASALAELFVSGHWIHRAMAAARGGLLPEQASGAEAAAMLGLHTLVYLALAFTFLARRDVRGEARAGGKAGRLERVAKALSRAVPRPARNQR